KRVLLRVDFNVPVKNSKVIDSTRINLVLPTIKYLQKKKAKIIIISHFGRPKGKRVKKYRLRPVYKNLKLKIKNLKFISDCFGKKVEMMIKNMKNGEAILLENLRFYPQEEENDRNFAKKLARFADVYVNDAFSVCHRKHSSIVAITKFLPSYAGFLLEKEIKNLSSVLKNPKRPFIVIIGGIKISTKLGAIKNLAKFSDKILIGGALANNFLKASNYNIGNSIYEKEMITESRKLLKKYKDKLILPKDFKIDFKKNISFKKISELNKIKTREFLILDIGPRTIEIFTDIIRNAKMIVWNGPMGYIEKKPFNQGTKKIAKAIFANKKAKIVIGGGETLEILKRKGKRKNIFISSGGGAMLKFLEGKILPGIKPLLK
ncbi:phosphoglycerate kinase, partial [bacterium]|nr:phosphoglycerate kinase [bacterium]